MLIRLLFSYDANFSRRGYCIKNEKIYNLGQEYMQNEQNYLIKIIRMKINQKVLMNWQNFHRRSHYKREAGVDVFK